MQKMITHRTYLSWLLLVTGLAACTTSPHAHVQRTTVARYYSPQQMAVLPLAQADSALSHNATPDAGRAPAADLLASAGAPVPTATGNEAAGATAIPIAPANVVRPQLTEPATASDAHQPVIKSQKVARQRARAADPSASTNGLAIASLVCGIVGFFFLAILLGPLAIVFGGVALSQIRRDGNGGRGLAIAGLILGIVVTVVRLISLATLAR